MHCIIKTFDQFIINHIEVKKVTLCNYLVSRRLSGNSYQATLQKQIKPQNTTFSELIFYFSGLKRLEQLFKLTISVS